MRFARPFPRSVNLPPDLTRRSGVVAVLAGISVFIAAAVTASGASADMAKPKQHVVKTGAAPELVWQAPVTAAPRPTVVPVANVRKATRRKPTPADRPAPVDHGVISALAANGIPAVALNAYRVAAARMTHVDPGCGIPWYLLAGIGREESDHGRFAGAVLHADGVSTPPIIGPALDGKHWDYIPAPANGMALDGDAKYAHALGPMQFIPSTWASWGADADGDGKADIFNINDAALGAARYLCAAGGNLTKHAGQATAVLAYNHNSQYLAQVLALAKAYALSVKVTGKPKGNTTGKLPKAHKGGYLPPVNPGAPTANGGKPSSAKPVQVTGTPTPGPTTRPAPTTTSSRPKPSPTGSGSSTSCTSPTGSPTKSRSSAASVAAAASNASVAAAASNASAAAATSSAHPRPTKSAAKSCAA